MGHVLKSRGNAMRNLFDSKSVDALENDRLFRMDVKQLDIQDNAATGSHSKYVMFTRTPQPRLSVKEKNRLSSDKANMQYTIDTGVHPIRRMRRTEEWVKSCSEERENIAIDSATVNKHCKRSRGFVNMKEFSFLTVFFVIAMLIISASAKSEVAPDDDFDSSNKKVKFEDFDTNVTPMPASGGASGGSSDTHATDKSNPDGSSLGFIHAFIASFSVIVVSELGDKTFFIAAIMAMRHARITVFAGAISALGLMTVLSALFGYATTIIPAAITYYISTALFAIFGLKMIYDGFRMSPDEGAEELEEVQATLRRRDDDNNDIESQKEASDTNQGYKLPSPLRRVLFTLFSRVFLQAFTMTFLAEWGDRSQLATIILAAREDVPGVCIGGVLGHSCCTGLAVLGGRMVAAKISVRTVTIIGGVVFLIFAITSLFFNPDNL